MAYHRGRTRRRRLAPVRLLSSVRMGVGYLMLADLQNFGLTIERDLYISEHTTVKELADD